MLRPLFDWFFVLLYKLLRSILNAVDFVESFFDVFAGTAKVLYKGSSQFLINIFFGHDIVTKAFWAMALIAVVLSFGFCIFAVARKVTDISGKVKNTVGEILSNFVRCLLIILLLNAITVATINITNVLLDRMNYALENASSLDREDVDKEFTDKEFAAMARVFATIGNYSVNPSPKTRYNINSCFNAIRNELLTMEVNGFFDYDYGPDRNGHLTWQLALMEIALSADLTEDLPLDTYYPDVANALETAVREMKTYPDFAPVKTALVEENTSISTDVLIFLISTMDAPLNPRYRSGTYDDALRRGYVTGEKDYRNQNQVEHDFDLWEIDYFMAFLASITFVLIMAITIFTFIVRLFNLVLLYLMAPLFVSSMPLDDGAKFQSWTQAFVIQLFSGFGSIVAMRIYLIIVPIALSSDLTFFSSAVLNRMAQLTMVLAGAWAVMKASSLINGILAGNPGMAAIQQEGAMSQLVTGGSMRALRAINGSVLGLGRSMLSGSRQLGQRAAAARRAKSGGKSGGGNENHARTESRNRSGGASSDASAFRGSRGAGRAGGASAGSKTAGSGGGGAAGKGGGAAGKGGGSAEGGSSAGSSDSGGSLIGSGGGDESSAFDASDSIRGGGTSSDASAFSGVGADDGGGAFDDLISNFGTDFMGGGASSDDDGGFEDIFGSAGSDASSFTGIGADDDGGAFDDLIGNFGTDSMGSDASSDGGAFEDIFAGPASSPSAGSAYSDDGGGAFDDLANNFGSGYSGGSDASSYSNAGDAYSDDGRGAFDDVVNNFWTRYTGSGGAASHNNVDNAYSDDEGGAFDDVINKYGSAYSAGGAPVIGRHRAQFTPPPVSPKLEGSGRSSSSAPAPGAKKPGGSGKK